MATGSNRDGRIDQCGRGLQANTPWPSHRETSAAVIQRDLVDRNRRIHRDRPSGDAATEGYVVVLRIGHTAGGPVGGGIPRSATGTIVGETATAAG